MGGVIDGLVFFDGPRAALLDKGHVVIQLATPGTYFVPVEDTPEPGVLVSGFLGLTEWLAEEAAKAGTAARAKTSAELRKQAADTGEEMELRRKNAKALIAAGAVVTLGTDNYWAAAAELSRAPKPAAARRAR